MAELSAQVICVNDELSDLKSRFGQTSREKEELESSAAALKSNLEKVSNESFELTKNLDEVQKQLEIANKVSKLCQLVLKTPKYLNFEFLVGHITPLNNGP